VILGSTTTLLAIKILFHRNGEELRAKIFEILGHCWLPETK
jgi:hypothetical protein